MKVIGLTGGIASGKSSVGSILQKFGVRVIGADQVAHQIYQPGTPGYAKVMQEFGPQILDAGGKINRSRLGEIVFGSAEARLKLEAITHPLIMQKINDLIDSARLQNLKIIVVEVPLLFEASLENQFDEIWVVSSTPESQLERLISRNQLTREQAIARLSAQLPICEKEAKAHVVIRNNGNFGDLEEEVKRLLEERQPYN